MFLKPTKSAQSPKVSNSNHRAIIHPVTQAWCLIFPHKIHCQNFNSNFQCFSHQCFLFFFPVVALTASHLTTYNSLPLPGFLAMPTDSKHSQSRLLKALALRAILILKPTTIRELFQYRDNTKLSYTEMMMEGKERRGKGGGFVGGGREGRRRRRGLGLGERKWLEGRREDWLFKELFCVLYIFIKST